MLRLRAQESEPEEYVGYAPAELSPLSLRQRMLSACLGSLVTSFVLTPFDVIRIRMQQQEMISAEICCDPQEPASSLKVQDPVNEIKKRLTIDRSHAHDLFNSHDIHTSEPGPRGKMSNEVNKTIEINKATHADPIKLSEPSQKPPKVVQVFNTERMLWEKYTCRPDNCPKFTSTFDGFASVVRNEGIFTLWRGLSLNLIMAIPANIIYLTGYEYIRDHSPTANYQLNPLFCGSLARIVTATAVAPAELLKTRVQSIPNESGSTNVIQKALKEMISIAKQKGVGSMFAGLSITLWRDAPFSGIYWLGYEALKKRIAQILEVDFSSAEVSVNQDSKVFATSFLAGSISGSIAAIFTQPFDVGKTRLQISTTGSGDIFPFLRRIYLAEGPAALFGGLGPRLLKVAPACAIMISSYEAGKKFFKSTNV